MGAIGAVSRMRYKKAHSRRIRRNRSAVPKEVKSIARKAKE